MNKKSQRVGIYLRLSDEDNDKINKYDVSESIKNQRNMLIEEINKNPNYILTDEYCDENLSGAGTYRPEFERLIKDCKNKKIDIVLCKSQSRFSRDMEIIEKYINNKFKEWNIRFISLSDNADTENPGNKKSRQINGLVNEWYLEDVSNNIRSAFNAKMKQGEFISPFAPFGYEISKENNNKLIIDPIASEIVKKIYTLYLNGYGYVGIAKYLNQKNISCPSLYKFQKGCKLNIVSNKPIEEIKWNSNAIKTILTNEVYIGNLIQGKRTTVSYKNHKIIKKRKEEWIKKENMHDAIIDKETFEKVKKIIKERTKPKNNNGIVHIFSGKVFCKECCSYMRKKNSKNHQYLVCSNNCNGYNNCLNKKSIRYDKLEQIILESINNIIKRYYDEKEINKINKTKKRINISNILKKQKKEINKRILETNKFLQNLYEDKVNEIITLEQFKLLNKSYISNKNMYNKQIKEIENQIFFYNSKKENNIKLFNKYKKITNLNKIIIDEFIDKIYIGKLNKENQSRDIQIIWNFK